MLGDALSEAFSILVRVGVAGLVWAAARHFATEYEPVAKGRSLLAYARVAGACAFLSLMAWANYGTHIEDADPIYGGGTEVQDFEPTDEERNKHGLVVFLVIFGVAAHGTWYGRRHA